MKCSAPPAAAVGPYAPTVRFDDGFADGQTHAAALRLGCEERIEDLAGLARRQPGPGVVYRNLNLAVLLQLRFDLKDTTSVAHRFDAIQHQVHEHLLDLHTVCNDDGETVGEIRTERNCVPGSLPAQQHNHLADHIVDR